jgi:hypothetical protein
MFIIILPNTCFDAGKGEDEGGEGMKNEAKCVKKGDISSAWLKSKGVAKRGKERRQNEKIRM